jgi:hypothetical protein
MIGAARFFWKGQCYVTVSSPDNSPETIEAIKSLSLYLESSVRGSTEGIPLLEAFPGEGKVHESEQYFAVDLVGHDFMGGGFVATYEEKGNRFKVFLCPKKSPEMAKEAFAKLRKSLGDYGEINSEIGGVGEMSFRAKDRYVGNWLVGQNGRFIVGAMGFHDEEVAGGLLADLCQRLAAFEE